MNTDIHFTGKWKYFQKKYSKWFHVKMKICTYAYVCSSNRSTDIDFTEKWKYVAKKYCNWFYRKRKTAHTQCEKVKNLLSHKKHRQINSLLFSLSSKNVSFTNFLSKQSESKYPQFPHFATVRQLQNFSVTQILREIKFGWSTVSKSAISHLEAQIG